MALFHWAALEFDISVMSRRGSMVEGEESLLFAVMSFWYHACWWGLARLLKPVSGESGWCHWSKLASVSYECNICDIKDNTCRMATCLHQPSCVSHQKHNKTHVDVAKNLPVLNNTFVLYCASLLHHQNPSFFRSCYRRTEKNWIFLCFPQ